MEAGKQGVKEAPATAEPAGGTRSGGSGSLARFAGGRGAILLSALVYPGAGQFLQRRWAAAWAFAVSFSAVLVWFMVSLVRILSLYYGLAAQFDGSAAAPPPPRWGVLLWSLGIGLLLFVAGILDTWLAERRRHRAAHPVNR